MGIPTAPEGHLNTKDHPAYSRGSQIADAGNGRVVGPAAPDTVEAYRNTQKPAGYLNADPNAVAKGVMSGTVKILTPGK